MATLEQYLEVAPTIMAIGEFTVNQIENKFEDIPEPPEPSPEPEITKAKIIAIFNAVFDNEYNAQRAIEKIGGIHKIAGIIGLNVAQVKTEMQAMLSVYKVEGE